jgi:D-amino-acid dehydrogenase
MRVLIIGSGLLGVTSAYFLKSRGHDVVVLEREAGAGQQTSFANGSMLSPGTPEPWNAPGCWRYLLASIVQPQAALKLRLHVLPSLFGWGVRFLKNSRPALFERNLVSNYHLSMVSLRGLQALRQELNLEYPGTTRGTLKIFRHRAGFDAAVRMSERLQLEGLAFARLSRDETVSLEPALSPIAHELLGGLHLKSDETGDAHRFCVALAEEAQRRGVEFAYGTSVTGIDVRAGRVTRVRTAQRDYSADHYVVAAGSYSAPLVRPLGIDLPVRPAKGYSVTFDPPHQASLSMPINDDDMHAVVVPLGNAIRAAGTAEFAGFDLTLRPERVRNLINLAQRVLPSAGLDAARARAWCGLRPMSPDGVPVVGATALGNLWVNTGHGPLGWTMAVGSGQLLADLMSGHATAVDPSAYALARFAA